MEVRLTSLGGAGARSGPSTVLAVQASEELERRNGKVDPSRDPTGRLDILQRLFA